MSSTQVARQTGERFVHEALLYEGEDDFVHRTTEFIDGGLVADEPVFVVVPERKIDLLRDALGPAADAVRFADMAKVGTNPARIISAWQAFLAEHAGSDRSLRGIGEPVFPERSPAELAECERHEALLNLAFADTTSWWLLCPYDVAALDPAVVDAAHRTHPVLQRGAVHRDSRYYQDPRGASLPMAGQLPPPPADALVLPFGSLARVRSLVAEHAVDARLSPRRIDDFVLAVNEIATNSLEHGGGQGVATLWRDGPGLVCEIRDAGHITDPLVGRMVPRLEGDGGRGVWLANHLCDLVEVRSSPEGSTIRLRIRS
jgi:anti-sigma regulatory factor (Ser/Thr protein kinase)